MARKVYVDLSNSLESWRQKTNILSNFIGDLDDLQTDSVSTVVSAINSMENKFITQDEALGLFSVDRTPASPDNGTYVNLSYNSTNGLFTINVKKLVPNDIPDLDASKTTSGQFHPDRIPLLDAAKIATGVFHIDRIPYLDASRIHTGIFNLARIPNLPASKTTSGEFHVDRIPTLPPSKIDTSSGTTIGRDALPDQIFYLDEDQTVTADTTFSGDVVVNGVFVPNAASTRNIGASGNEFATAYIDYMVGTAQFANYADVAEKYLPDQEYEVGTVLMIGGEAEVTQCNGSCIPAGVVSDKPAYLMNNDLEGGVAVALVGRVPVKVNGPVKKGEGVYADGNGAASRNGTGRLVGIALESSNDTNIHLVECMLKL